MSKSNDLARLAHEFTAGKRNVAANGWIQLPGGVILAWGETVTFGAAATGTIAQTYGGAPFTIAPFVAVSDFSNASNKMALGTSAVLTTGFDVTYYRLTGTATTHKGRWIAIGY